MLQLHFTTEDVLRTRFAPGPAPLMELGLGLATLQGDDDLFRGWRATARRALPRQAAPLIQLIPPSGAGPVFLDPLTSGLAEGIDEVLATPTSTVRTELRRVFASDRPVTPWVRALDARDRDSWSILAAAITSAYDAIIGPSWARIAAGFRAELALRAELMAIEGFQAGLASLFPGSSWAGASLRIPSSRASEVALEGRGLTLLPSALWRGHPLMCAHVDGSLLLVYPSAAPLPLVADADSADALAALLGLTRATLLREAAVPRTTTELARLADVSIGSASQHAKVLRAAGLVASRRDGRAILHCATPLGLRLLGDGR